MREKNVFIIRWYGPFSSREELETWESRKKECYYLYIFQGKTRKNSKFKYYCGMTYHRKDSPACVANRMGDSNHHIHLFEKSHPETIIIWVGAFANVSRTKKADVKLCEKMLTSELTMIELDDNKHENKTNKLPPDETVYIINEWYRVKKNNDGDYDDHEDYNSKNKDVIPNIVPDVMCYYAETSALYRVKKLRWVADLSS